MPKLHKLVLPFQAWFCLTLASIFLAVCVVGLPVADQKEEAQTEPPATEEIACQ
jgi:hypothetical protein